MAATLPINESQARRTTRWLLEHFGEPMHAIIEETPATPFSVEVLCGIVCQETACFFVRHLDTLTPAQVLARCVFDASGDAAGTARSAFPKDTAAFRAAYGDAFTRMLVDEANETRALRGMGPKPWVYKGYGIFQYDLQYVAQDERFFRERLWRDFDACLRRAMSELTRKFAARGELWAAVKAYNGSGPKAAQYAENVQVFTAWAKNEMGRVLAGVPAGAPAKAAPAARGRRTSVARRARGKGIVPDSRPRMTPAELRERLEALDIDRTVHPLVVVGIRGYYKDTMGAPGVNDRGIYDDALFIDSVETFTSFNGNTDPSAYRKGQGIGEKKGMASINPGVCYAHRFGLHRGKYLALCQLLGHVSVTRDGDPPYLDTGDFGINIHKGGYKTTSSLGCQTIHPDQWDSFIALAVDQAKRFHGSRWNKVVIPYVLIDATA